MKTKRYSLIKSQAQKIIELQGQLRTEKKYSEYLFNKTNEMEKLLMTFIERRPYITLSYILELNKEKGGTK